ncbi:MAG: T9SS type A sorting domain-containing protein, partial [Candidatus Bipolaricaulota bacterium]
TARPNPFRGSTSFTVRLDRTAHLEVRILDTAGRVVRRLTAGSRAKGPHAFTWDGLADDDQPVAAGTYFIRAESGDQHRTQKVVLLR